MLCKKSNLKSSIQNLELLYIFRKINLVCEKRCINLQRAPAAAGGLTHLKNYGNFLHSELGVLKIFRFKKKNNLFYIREIYNFLFQDCAIYFIYLFQKYVESANFFGRPFVM